MEKNMQGESGAGLSLEITSEEMNVLLEETRDEPELRKLLESASTVGKRRRLTLQEEEWENLAGLLSKAAFNLESSRRQALLDNIIEAVEDLLLMDDEEDEPD